MKLRVIDSDPQSDHHCNGLILTEDFGLVGFVYSDYAEAIDITRMMVDDFNRAQAEREKLASGVERAFARASRSENLNSAKQEGE